MRYFAAAFLLLAICVALVGAPEKPAIKVQVNGKALALKAQAVMRQGKPWVPMEEVSKPLGGHIEVIKPGKWIGLCLGKTKCVPLRVGAPEGAVMIKGTAYAPAKVVADALEAKYSWKPPTVSFTKT